MLHSKVGPPHIPLQLLPGTGCHKIRLAVDNHFTLIQPFSQSSGRRTGDLSSFLQLWGAIEFQLATAPRLSEVKTDRVQTTPTLCSFLLQTWLSADRLYQHDLSYSRNSLKRVIWGSIMGVITGDTKSLDNGSCEYAWTSGATSMTNSHLSQ